MVTLALAMTYAAGAQHVLTPPALAQMTPMPTMSPLPTISPSPLPTLTP